MRRSVARALLAMLMVCASALGLAGTAAAGTEKGGTDKAAYRHVGDDFLKARIPAILTVDCLLGAPPAGAQEGIKLKVPGLIDFDTIVPGSATVFVQI